MLPNGMFNRDFVLKDGIPRGDVPALFMAKPASIGAQRLYISSTDPDYVAHIKETFYGDVPEEEIETFKAYLHPDEPAEVTSHPSPITPENFGRIPRHYIRCTEDKAITLSMQDEMIAMVDAQIGNQTQVHTLYASHSPFLSMPDKLAEILIKTI